MPSELEINRSGSWLLKYSLPLFIYKIHASKHQLQQERKYKFYGTVLSGQRNDGCTAIAIKKTQIIFLVLQYIICLYFNIQLKLINLESI